MFSGTTSTILQSEANAGYNLNVIYNPTSNGSHTGVVTISGGGLTNFTVNLSGTK
jgi:hypothetical protein